MRTNRALAIAAAFGLGVSFGASANVVYDSETTNAWFNANIKTSSALSSEWTCPKDGTADVKGESNAYYIALDTDLDDPLTYAASGASADIAVVAAEMTATVNAAPPQITAAPQAALVVIGDATAAKWTGLVGKEGGGTEWVTFQNLAPVIGTSYSVRIEFDQRETRRRIRYLVNGVILLGAGSTDGWYPNPQASADVDISKVSFSGSGDIKALAGESITENTIAFGTPTEAEGFDYTNGTISISADIQGYENVTATLTVTGTDGATVVPHAQGGSDTWSWDLNDLTQGGIYSYTIEAQAGGKTIATKTGTFTAAHWPTDWSGVWFGADATSGTEVTKGGKWDPAKEQPVIANNEYVIEDGAVFDVTDQEPGSNHVTRVDTKVMFETLVDANSLSDVTEEEGALGGFVAAKDGETPQWMALTADGGSLTWIALTGAPAPAVNVPYVIRAEVDFISDTKCVRFLVSVDSGTTFVPLSSAGNQWIPLATQTKYSLAAVEMKGSGKVARFEAKVADKALAVVAGVEYDSMDAALAAAKDGTKSITLLTNATVDPTDKGSYDIVPGGHHYMFGGNDSTEARTLVVTEPGQPPLVRPSEAVMKGVTTPDNKSYKDCDSLRKFLEKNGVAAYTTDDSPSSAEITSALNEVPQGSKNNLPLWEDYVMGIEPDDPVDPVTTPAGDTDEENITLAIPAIAAGKPSGDYDLVFKVVDEGDNQKGVDQKDANAIKIPLATGKYKVKVIFTEPANN